MIDEIQMTEKERADRLEAMIDRMADKLSQIALLDHKLLELSWEIEKCGASEQLTKTVVMAGEIRSELREILGNEGEIYINVQKAMYLIREERKRQFVKWGWQNHQPYTWMAILMEEVGEASQACLHDEFGGKAAGMWKTEVIHTAAVAMQILEWIIGREREAAR
jgi:hypothetical protein